MVLSKVARDPVKPDFRSQARTVVRFMLMNALDDARVLTSLVRAGVSPADLEEKVAEIMRYLKETRS